MRIGIYLSALLVLALVAPAALAEDWPPVGQERFRVYWTGSCGVSKTYNGHFELDCWDDPHYSGTRSGRWRVTTDTDCDTAQLVSEVYEVCTTGGNCTWQTGTWAQITQQQFDNEYCP